MLEGGKVMTIKLGSDSYTYEVVVDWAKLPEGWTFHEVVDVAVDSEDRVYVFNRGEHPLMVFDREGNFLTAWGEGKFKRPHGITIGPDDMLYLADDDAHIIQKYTTEGELLMTIGTPGIGASFQSGDPFNKPTKVALEPETGNLYISDGYGNARVHKYSPDGKHLFSWGASGCGPGEFNLVHSVCTDKQGYVYVADRENHRIQIFDANGNLHAQWHNMHRPCGLYIDEHEEIAYIGELGPQYPFNEGYPNLGPRVSIYNLTGELLVRIGERKWGEDPDQFIAPHGIASDSRGDVYVGEVSFSAYGKDLDPPRELRCFRKLIKIS